MKIRRFLPVFIAIVAVAFMSCELYDDGLPPKAARTEFRSMYSGARDVEWDREGTNWEVSYEIDRVEYESLFDASGKWLMTKKEVSYANVPDVIRTYLSTSEYGTYRLDDNTVDFYQTPDGNFYRFELDDNGRDLDVDVTESGVVSRARRDLF